MASIAKFRFISPGIVGESVLIKTGVSYTFKEQRLAFREVGIRDNIAGYNFATIYAVALNFKNAFSQDDNYLGRATVSLNSTYVDQNGNALENPQWIVEIEHPENDYFNGFQNNTTFILTEVETTAQEIDPEINIQVLPSEQNVCGQYKLEVTTNKPGSHLIIEVPTGFVKVGESFTGEWTGELTRPINSIIVFKGGVKMVDDAGELLAFKAFDQPPVIGITNVEVAGSQFGAMATIEVIEYLVAQNLQYSIDGVSYQQNRQYTGLSAGDYTAYVKDELGCIKTKSFTVTEADTAGNTVKPKLEVGIHNSLRMFHIKEGLKTFLNYSSDEMPGYAIEKRYTQKYPLSDGLIQMQMRSSYSDHVVSLAKCDGEINDLLPIKKSNNIQRVEIIEGNYKEVDGKLAVYFTNGNEYNENGSIKGTHNYNGTLPIFYEKGLPIQIENKGATQILEIYEDQDDAVRYAITGMDADGIASDLKITTIHNEHNYDVFDFDVPILEEGIFLTHIEAGEEEMRSELLEFMEELPDNYMKVQWFNNSNDFILYNTGIRPHRWLEYDGYFHWVPKSERNVYYTDNSGYITSSKSLAVFQVHFEAMPMELARGLEVAFTNSNFVLLNDVVFIADGNPKAARVGTSNFYELTVDFTLVEKTIKGQQTVQNVVDAGFVIVDNDDPNAPGFWRIH